MARAGIVSNAEYDSSSMGLMVHTYETKLSIPS